MVHFCCPPRWIRSRTAFPNHSMSTGSTFSLPLDAPLMAIFGPIANSFICNSWLPMFVRYQYVTSWNNTPSTVLVLLGTKTVTGQRLGDPPLDSGGRAENGRFMLTWGRTCVPHGQFKAQFIMPWRNGTAPAEDGTQLAQTLSKFASGCTRRN